MSANLGSSGILAGLSLARVTQLTSYLYVRDAYGSSDRQTLRGEIL